MSATGKGNQPMGYYPGPESIEETSKIEYGELAMISFTGLADVALTREPGEQPGAAITDPDLRAVYFGALLDLHKLVEEFRFHVAFAHLIVLDIGEKVRAGEAEKRPPDPVAEALGGIPDEPRALLLPHMRQPPPVVQFFRDPHTLIAGDRRLSAWVGGQMIDSALVRGVAGCDRIATMLWARTGLPLPKGRTGQEFLPDFSIARLTRLEDYYTDRDEWVQLKELTEHMIYIEVRKIRDRFTHARRIPAELHGEALVSSIAGPTHEGMPANVHLALGLGFYNLVLQPVVELAGRLLANPSEDS